MLGQGVLNKKVQGRLMTLVISVCVASPYYTLQRKNAENSKQMFPEMKLRCLGPNSYIHVFVRDLFIPTIGLPILLQENRWTDRWNI